MSRERFRASARGHHTRRMRRKIEAAQPLEVLFTAPFTVLRIAV
jgi:hypothetical protein